MRRNESDRSINLDPQTVSQINQLGGDVERRSGTGDTITCSDPSCMDAIAGLLTEQGIGFDTQGSQIKLRESTGNNNAGNLLIGQTVDVLVIDALGNEFLRPMQVGEFYPANTVLMRDIDTQDTVVLVFDQDESNKLRDGLVYLNVDPRTGVVYKMVISSNLLSNQSITSHFLNESRRPSLTSNSRLSHIIRVTK